MVSVATRRRSLSPQYSHIEPAQRAIRSTRDREHSPPNMGAGGLIGYPDGMTPSLFVLFGTWLGLLCGAAVLHLLPRLGSVGRGVSAWLCRAPGLDGVMTYFVALPLILGPIFAGWWGLGAAVLGQLLMLWTWTIVHELAHPDARRGPRIVKVLNRAVGTLNNHAALWIMVPAVPMFWLVRVTQYVIYPPLTWLVGLPKYRTGEWVNVSRQKFAGLVGHDRIWCLYCDWMTGLWSLGSEMLRNIESMWCPIRFSSEAKCENCRIDFPDVFGTEKTPGWVPADSDVAAAAKLLEEQYEQSPHRGWFAHPARLTVEGEAIEHSASNVQC